MISSLSARRIAGLCLAAVAALSGATALLAPPAPATAQTAPSQQGFPTGQLMPLPGFAHERYREMPVDGAVVFGTLPNGLRYAVQRNPRPEGEVAIRMRVAAGSLVENAAQSGLMHFLEHMAFNGSENVAENEFDQLLAREGLAFGADTNAYTSFDETVYRLDMPKADKLPLGLMLMRETASRLLLANEAIDRERGIILSEERARATPGFNLYRAYLNHIAPGMMLNDRFPIGDMDVVRNAPRDRFVELYRGFYTPERTFIVVVGDMDTAAMVAEIEKAFGDWTPAAGTAQPDPDLGRHVPNDGAVKTYVEAQLPPAVLLTVTRPYQNEEDTIALRRRSLARSLAMGVVNTRFARLARQESAPFVSAGLDIDTTALSFSATNLAVTPKDDARWRASMDVAELELRKALTHGFTEEELRVALADVRSDYQTAVTQKDSRRSAGIANGLVGDFANDAVTTTPETDLAVFDRIASTISADYALQQLREIWPEGRQPAIFVSTTAPLAGGEAAVRRAYAEASARPVPQPEQLRTRPWSITRFGPSVPSYSRTDIADLGVTQVAFANNVRLVIKQTDFEPGRIRVAVNFGEGDASLFGAPKGTDMAIQAMYVAGGLRDYEIDELGRALAGRTVGLGFGVGEESYSFTGTTTREDLVLQLQLFGAYLTQPAFRPDGFNQLRGARDAIFRGLRATPSAAWGNFGGPVLRNNDQRFARITEAEFDALSPDDARARFEPALKDGPLEIVIIGDVPVADAIQAVQRTLAQLPARRATPQPDPRALSAVFTPGRGEDTLTHEGRPDQSLAMIYWPMRDYGDGADVRAVRVMTEVLQTRLNEVIREEEGGTYSPSSVWNPSTSYPGFGLIGATMEVKPEDASRLLARVEAIAAEMAAGRIDEDHFNRSRTPLIADFAETSRNNPWWLNWLQGSSWDAERLEVIRGGQRHYEQVTLEEVRRLAARYLDASKARIVRVVPANSAVVPAAEATPATAQGE